MEIGNNQIQGMDYNYTIHGWLKGVNSTSLNKTNDPGNVGQGNDFAADEMGYSLNYYSGDYSAINSPSNDFLVDVTGSDFEAAQQNLYNGNISQMVTGIKAFMQGSTSGLDLGPQGMNYTYDQLNRLKTANAYGSTQAIASNSWGATTAKAEYGVVLSYDPNGNIMSLKRNGSSERNIDMDDLEYTYATMENGNTKNTNRLWQVTDNESFKDNYQEDIDSQEEYNYSYDKIGNLVKDNAEHITIKWNVQGKVTEVIKDDGVAGQDLEFKYDAMGNRIVKIVKPRLVGGLEDQSSWLYTYYVRDASGNVMAIYSKRYQDAGTSTYKEIMVVNDFNLFGSDRLGTYKNDLDKPLAEREFTISSINTDDKTFVEGTSGLVVENAWDMYTFNHYIGNRSFEAKNHLGNVLVVFSDSKQSFDLNNDGVTDSYSAIVLSANDYYPFGMLMPDRNVSSDDYRYGFNGKEKDNEILGAGNFMDMGMRCYDTRLGRMFQIDPRASEYAWQTTYAYHRNSPIWKIDYLGGGDDDDTKPTISEGTVKTQGSADESITNKSPLAKQVGLGNGIKTAVTSNNATTTQISNGRQVSFEITSVDLSEYKFVNTENLLSPGVYSTKIEAGDYDIQLKRTAVGKQQGKVGDLYTPPTEITKDDSPSSEFYGIVPNETGGGTIIIYDAPALKETDFTSKGLTTLLYQVNFTETLIITNRITGEVMSSKTISWSSQIYATHDGKTIEVKTHTPSGVPKPTQSLEEHLPIN